MNKELLKDIGKFALELFKLAGLITVLILCVYGLYNYFTGGIL